MPDNSRFPRLCPSAIKQDTWTIGGRGFGIYKCFIFQHHATNSYSPEQQIKYFCMSLVFHNTLKLRGVVWKYTGHIKSTG